MRDLEFYKQVVAVLESVAAPYMIVGAFAAQAFGVTRATFDVDIVISLTDDQIEALCQRFPPPRYYADREMMRDSMRSGQLFNVIDSTAGVKADLVPAARDVEAQAAFNRRIRQTISDDDGQTWEAWFAQPGDVIIGKLRAWTEGKSSKHADDIYALLAHTLSGLGNTSVDVQTVTRAAAQLGNGTLRLWESILARAERDSRSSRPF